MNYTSAENTYSLQLATAYAVYEMLGDLYSKCSFKNPIEETHLTMHFKSQKIKKQYELENKVTGIIEKCVHEELADLRCEVRSFSDGRDYIMHFLTYVTDFEVSVSKDGRIKVTRNR